MKKGFLSIAMILFVAVSSYSQSSGWVDVSNDDYYTANNIIGDDIASMSVTTQAKFGVVTEVVFWFSGEKTPIFKSKDIYTVSKVKDEDIVNATVLFDKTLSNHKVKIYIYVKGDSAACVLVPEQAKMFITKLKTTKTTTITFKDSTGKSYTYVYNTAGLMDVYKERWIVFDE